MSDSSSPMPGGHLDFYIKHAISPVRYRMDDFQAHVDRRDSLYRSLGLPPVVFKGTDILEVASGSGQNSIYLAICNPTTLTLVEPNPDGRNDIVAAYDALEVPHTRPTLVPSTLQEFAPDRQYDIVICENWLGALPHEVALIDKLASLVTPGGVLVITIVPLAGFFPNVMRKLLAMRLVSADQDFESKTAFLTDIFGPHLATITNMTRSHRDWVRDCMINPHYLNVGLPLSTVLDTVGERMEALATFPRFTTDWRWFKGLTGPDRRFNEQLAEAEAANLPSFIDYRKTYPPGDAGEYQALNQAFNAVHELALSWQAAHEAGDDNRTSELTARIGGQLAEIEKGLALINPEPALAIAELRSLWLQPVLTAAEVRDMREFGKLFGRETVYLSLIRSKRGGQPVQEV